MLYIFSDLARSTYDKILKIWYLKLSIVSLLLFGFHIIWIENLNLNQELREKKKRVYNTIKIEEFWEKLKSFAKPSFLTNKSIQMNKITFKILIPDKGYHRSRA